MMYSQNIEFDTSVHNIYPHEVQIKDTSDSAYSASYLELTTRLYSKRDGFNFPSSILISPVHGVFGSQLERYARECSGYRDDLVRKFSVSVSQLSQDVFETKIV